MMYNQLCTEFYDIDKQFATDDELKLYFEQFNTSDLLLEPMCGSGRLLIPLLQAGYQVHGFDSSQCMLESCKRRAEQLHLTTSVTLNNIESISIKQKYDGIIIPLGSFQLLYPRTNAYMALEKFKNLLAPGGKLILDFFIPWEALYENAECETSTRQVDLPTGECIIAENQTTVDKWNQHMLSKTSYKKMLLNNLISQENETINILWYYPFEIILMLERYGFSDIKRIDRFLNNHEQLTYIAYLK